jgi:tRNA-dihydrouridine synthase
LEYSETERPIVAQLFSSNPEYMREASALCKNLGFDGIDINMGCPDKGVERQGAGAALMKNPALARLLVRAAKEGGGGLPVSVKTRIGYNKNELDTWLPELLAENPAVITIHARTRKEMSKVPARWEEVKRAVEIRNNLKSDTLIFGNGDALDLSDGKAKVESSGADGVMLGRAIFGNPFLFSSLYAENKNVPSESEGQIPIEQKLQVLLEHTKLFEELLGEVKSFALMKKHFKSYVAGFPQSVELRIKLMEAENSGEVEATINAFLSEERS